jgi:hypothetical protein
MTTEPVPLKVRLAEFVVAFSLGAILLNELPPKKPIQRAQALAIVTSDEIKSRMDVATDDDLIAMILVGRLNLRTVRSEMMRHPFPVEAAKAKHEWIANAKRLMSDTKDVGRE